MIKNNLFISIIIPTRNSSSHLETLLRSIKKQNYKKLEIIIADNDSTDSTLEIASKYNARILSFKGKPPIVAQQRNEGAKKSKGQFLYFMDHDMELSDNFISRLDQKIHNKKYLNIDAWYVPEVIISNSKILSIARNFESKFINGTVVSAARIISKKKFFTLAGYDSALSGGPADWDLDIQLKLKKARFGVFEGVVYHHEEKLNLFTYILKKTTYLKGEDIYKKKWINNTFIYKNVIEKQYSLKYRILYLFIENGNWKKLVTNIHRYIVFLFVKISMAVFYDYRRRRNV